MTMTDEPSAPDRPAGALRDPATLAPSADRAWASDFVLEQRLLGVPGARIGDALVTIESHLVDSGETAQEAFGDATAYARALAGGERVVEPALSVRTVVASVLGVVGMLVTVTGFGPWLAGEPAEITAGMLAATALLLVVLAGFLASATAVMRAAVGSFWLPAAALVLFIGASVASLVLLDDVLVEVPATTLLALGVLMLLTDAVLTWFDHGQDDTVLAPGEAAPRPGLGRVLATFTVPVFTLVLLGVAWLIQSLA